MVITGADVTITKQYYIKPYVRNSMNSLLDSVTMYWHPMGPDH